MDKTEKKNPLDPVPDAIRGNVWVDPKTDRACVLTGEERQRALAEGQPLYLSHFVTCPNAVKHRNRTARRG